MKHDFDFLNQLRGRGLLAEAGTRIRETCGPAACMLVSDDRVFALYGEAVKKSLEEAGIPVEKGIFGADMKVSLVNNGPVTI